MLAVSLSNAVVFPRTNGLFRRLILYVALTLLLPDLTANAAGLPERWRWSNPTPLGGNAFGMANRFGLTVIVTERGQIFTSDDLEFWEPRESYTTNALRAVTFFGERLVITGENGTVLWADSLADFHLLSLDTTDWLEGVAASSEVIVAAGDNGAIYTSTNAVDWVRQPTPFTEWLTSVAHGQDKFVVVGEKGLVATSADGIEWEQQFSSTDLNLKRVAWFDNEFWAVGESGVVLNSSGSASNWSPIDTGATNTLFDVAGIRESKVVVGDQEIRLQLNNGEWTNQLDPVKPNAARPWTYLNALWDGSLFFLSGRSGMMVEGFQTNSTSPFFWVSRSEPIRNWLWDLKRLPEIYVTVGHQGTIMTSVDGIDWDLELVPDAATNTTLLGLGGTTNLLLAVGDNGRVLLSQNNYTNVVQTNVLDVATTNRISTLGIFWHTIPPPTTNALQGVVTFESQLVICGDYGTVLTSTNGTNWSNQTTPTESFLSGITTFPGGLVAVGQGGTILTSTNAITWTKQPSGVTDWIFRVRYLGDTLIAVGQNGTLLTSTNGLSWKRQSSTTTRWLTDIALIDKTYFVIGTQGTVLASTNQIDWLNIGTITEKSLYGIAAHEGQLVVAGVEGSIIRSQIRPIHSPVEILTFSRRDNQSVFLFGGEPDQRFTLDSSFDLEDWTTGLLLEFLDSTGTLLLIQPPTPDSIQTEFFRATGVP